MSNLYRDKEALQKLSIRALKMLVVVAHNSEASEEDIKHVLSIIDGREKILKACGVSQENITGAFYNKDFNKITKE